MTTEADKIVAELMALADEYSAAARDAQFAFMSRDAGLKYSEQVHAEARVALEQAIRRAVDWKLVACVVEPMHGNNGITWGREAHLNPPPVGTPLYARSQA